MYLKGSKICFHRLKLFLVTICTVTFPPRNSNCRTKKSFFTFQPQKNKDDDKIFFLFSVKKLKFKMKRRNCRKRKKYEASDWANLKRGQKRKRKKKRKKSLRWKILSQQIFVIRIHSSQRFEMQFLIFLKEIFQFKKPIERINSESIS